MKTLPALKLHAIGFDYAKKGSGDREVDKFKSTITHAQLNSQRLEEGVTKNSENSDATSNTNICIGLSRAIKPCGSERNSLRDVFRRVFDFKGRIAECGRPTGVW